MLSSYHIYSCGDHALTIELGDAIDVSVNNRVIALYNHLRAEKMQGIRDLIPSYHTLTLVYDLAFFRQVTGGAPVYDYLCNWLQPIIHQYSSGATPAVRRIRLPVCYDTSLGWDIEHIAETHSLSVEEVISLHTAPVYRVYLIGFLPGFPYMGKVDDRIATPRKTTPRTMVPSGSVGIAGSQTGIYPFASPGGWQLVGQTPVILFDAAQQQPCYLQPGDEVQFYPIDLAAYHQMKTHGHTHS